MGEIDRIRLVSIRGEPSAAYCADERLCGEGSCLDQQMDQVAECDLHEGLYELFSEGQTIL